MAVFLAVAACRSASLKVLEAMESTEPRVRRLSVKVVLAKLTAVRYALLASWIHCEFTRVTTTLRLEAASAVVAVKAMATSIMQEIVKIFFIQP